MNLYMPTRLFFGENCIQKHAGALRLGKSALIVTGASAAACGALDDVIAALTQNGISFRIFNQIKPNPKLSDCFEAAKQSADFVIGIGGGSPMDAAKAIAVLLENSSLTEQTLYAGQWDKARPIVCVGTTAGTGSEVTPVSVLTTADGRKKSIHNDCLYPTLSFADPKYTYHLPDSITRATAIDALAHCLESYFSKASTDFSQTYALRGAQILCNQFKKYDGKPTKQDRAALTIAALYGGLAIAVTGTAFPHALGYFLSEKHNLPHGIACGVYLKRFLAHNRTEAPALFARFFESLGTNEKTLELLIDKMMPPVRISVTEAEIRALYPRWENNATLSKTQGNMTPDFVTAMLLEMFCK